MTDQLTIVANKANPGMICIIGMIDFADATPATALEAVETLNLLIGRDQEQLRAKDKKTGYYSNIDFHYCTHEAGFTKVNDILPADQDNEWTFIANVAVNSGTITGQNLHKQIQNFYGDKLPH